MVSLGHSHRRASGASARSSMDDSKSDGPEDETTVVEPDQGNGEASSTSLFAHDIADQRHSSLAHHLAAAARRGSQPRRAADVYIGA
ncbi:hypothetical protein LSUE1_G000768 [Lachnellula suecica]|uniref:Uncharacterized protein n=1 Tax=Lachnellula suecica TaxID=602035 RepID=A0A8T9CL32_9HELO|nr:hypothetical protein LSUE1_G000768 [Lachnellula suecica]